MRKWLARWRAGGEPAPNDGSSAPARQRRLPSERVAAIAALRRQRLTSPVIARRLGLPLSTVGGVLRRLGLGRLKRVDPPAPVVRYPRQRPGELVHIDTKKLGVAGAVLVGLVITDLPGSAASDSASPAADPEWSTATAAAAGNTCRSPSITPSTWLTPRAAPDRPPRSALGARRLPDAQGQRHRLPRAALAWFAHHSVNLERIMPDNGNVSRSHDFRDACTSAGVRHLRTRPYTPRTDGNAERFLQTVMRECAYARAFRSSRERAAALPRWLHLYNVHRPHTALAGQPISRLAMNNLLGNDS